MHLLVRSVLPSAAPPNCMLPIPPVTVLVLPTSASTATPKTAPHLIHIRALQCMIRRICCSLVQNVGRRLAQLHPISLEPQITDPRNIISVIILHKQRQALHLAKERSFDRNILDLRGLRKAKFLSGSKIIGRGEINIVAVYEDFESLWS